MLVRRVPPDACTVPGEFDTPAQPVLLAQLSPLHAALTKSPKAMIVIMFSVCQDFTRFNLGAHFQTHFHRGRRDSAVRLFHCVAQVQGCKVRIQTLSTHFFIYNCLAMKLAPGGPFLCAVPLCVKRHYFILLYITLYY